MPSNDNFASATALAATTSGTLYTQSNASAGTQSGEPGHFNYNKNPFYPIARTIVGPFATVWYSWACPTTGNYYFSTRDLSGTNRTNFQSTLQAFTGSAVNSLTSVTYLMDQSVGDGDGADNGASIAFAATSGTTYYFQVDGRISGATGSFWLTWGAFAPIRLGTCSGETVNSDTRAVCAGSVTLSGTTSDAWFSFGTQPVKPGNYVVAYVDGTPVPQYANSVYPAPQVFPNVTIIDGDFSGFTRWNNSTAYTTSPLSKVIYLENYADYAAAYCTSGNTNQFPYLGGSSCNAPYWACYNAADTIQSVPCNRGLISHPASGVIGLCLLVNGTAIVAPYPSYNLLYYPMDTTVLNSSPGFVLTGSGTSWTISFYVQNNSDQTWDNTTVALLNTGGVTLASAALTGVSLAPNASTSVGFFTFTATPGMVTATIQLTRNGQVACTIDYPLYPVVSLGFIATGGGSGLNLFERTACTPAKTWVQAVRSTTVWPPNASALPSSWGNTLTEVFSIASGPATLANDNSGTNCAAVASITQSAVDCSGGGYTDNVFKPSIWVTGALQSVPIQCTVVWNYSGGGLSLPTFTQTLSIPAT